jgi:DNA mismatch endonuclease (patch repair protein)
MERALRAYLPRGEFGGTTPQRSRTMQAVRGKDNRTTERRLRLGLVRAGVRGWQVRPRGLTGNPDFFFPSAGIAVFVDGCFWHGCPTCGHIPRGNRTYWEAKIARNKVRDRRAALRLRADGYRVVRFWEHDMCNLQACVHSIQRELRRGL